MKFKIPINCRFALIGHGFNLYYLYEKLSKFNNKKPIIITHKKKFHLRDQNEFGYNKEVYRDIFELKKQTKIYEYNDINTSSFLKTLKKNKITHIFSCSSRFIFKDKLINKFKNKIYNIHGGHLPDNRGAGIFTNRILNSKFYCCGVIHIVANKVDGGKIILKSKKYKVSNKSKPQDLILKTNYYVYKILIDTFINKIKNESSFSAIKQNENKKSYFVRYNTNIHGAIDWNIEGKFIEKFIQAFSYPYPGAFTKIVYKKKFIKLRIFDSSFKKNSHFSHPFLHGKIFYQDLNCIKIIVKSGFLIVKLKDILIEGEGVDFFNSPKHHLGIKKLEGKTFFNTEKTLLEAKILSQNIFKFS